ncbi:hypothetical protein MAR_009862 [Mya arenaria]|uniref:Uncharacterized protein n=1 Tax=Mya arenaria TaxID=6604 RepID=A0ABY7E4I0_MYAAR|nr:hypothetical protein MAR_009862 [Mya arenaria]
MNASQGDVQHEKRRAQEFEAKYRELVKKAKSEFYKLEQANLKYKNDAKVSQDIISDKENEICVVRKELEQAESLSKNLNSKLKETKSAFEKALQDKEILQKALCSSRETLNGSGGSPEEETSAFCMKQSQRQLARIKSAVIASDDKDSSLPVLVSKQLGDCRKAVAETSGKNMIQVDNTIFGSSTLIAI